VSKNTVGTEPASDNLDDETTAVFECLVNVASILGDEAPFFLEGQA